MNGKNGKNAKLVAQIRLLQSTLSPGSVTPPPRDTRPRWKDGSLRDELEALEERRGDSRGPLDIERALVDSRYFDTNKTDILRYQQLHAKREAEQREAARIEQENARAERNAERRKEAEQRAKQTKIDRQRQQDAEIAARIDGYYGPVVAKPDGGYAPAPNNGNDGGSAA